MQKPYPDFPLFAHASGQWCKKIKGRHHYFGVLADPDAALETYLAERDYLQAGVTPPIQADTLAELLDLFLGEKNQQLDAGEISRDTYKEYEATCDVIAACLNKNRPLQTLALEDFTTLRKALSKRKDGKQYSPVTLKRRLTIARMVFTLAQEMGHILPFKRALKTPTKLVIRKQQRGRDAKLYTASQIRQLVKSADDQLAAMILLGINAGFGPKDCAVLPSVAIKGEWCNFPRPKTEVDRRCPLWPETVTALKKFEFNAGWDRFSIAKAFTALAADHDVPNHGFYSLRRTFETIATTADVSQAVIDHIMGHTRGDMASVYRQKVFDSRLRKCADHVRSWYLGSIELD